MTPAPATESASPKRRVLRTKSRRLQAIFSGNAKTSAFKKHRVDRKVRDALKHKKSSAKKPAAKMISVKKSVHKIIPGTVLIMLAGRYRGTRVVFLRELSSKLLLVSGPMRVNGVPLRRVNRAYVVRTSAKVDISEPVAKLIAKVDDTMFKKTKRIHAGTAAKTAKKEGAKAFFKNSVKKTAPKTVCQKFKSLQSKIDKGLAPLIAKVPYLRGYLSSKFTLTKGVFPHMLKF